MAWRMAEHMDGLKIGSLLDIAFSIEPDTYNGGWQLILKDFRMRDGVAELTVGQQFQKHCETTINPSQDSCLEHFR